MRRGTLRVDIRCKECHKIERVKVRVFIKPEQEDEYKALRRRLGARREVQTAFYCLDCLLVQGGWRAFWPGAYKLTMPLEPGLALLGPARPSKA